MTDTRKTIDAITERTLQAAREIELVPISRILEDTRIPRSLRAAIAREIEHEMIAEIGMARSEGHDLSSVLSEAFLEKLLFSVRLSHGEFELIAHLASARALQFVTNPHRSIVHLLSNDAEEIPLNRRTFHETRYFAEFDHLRDTLEAWLERRRSEGKTQVSRSALEKLLLNAEHAWLRTLGADDIPIVLQPLSDLFAFATGEENPALPVETLASFFEDIGIPALQKAFESSSASFKIRDVSDLVKRMLEHGNAQSSDLQSELRSVGVIL